MSKFNKSNSSLTNIIQKTTKNLDGIEADISELEKKRGTSIKKN